MDSDDGGDGGDNQRTILNTIQESSAVAWNETYEGAKLGRLPVLPQGGCQVSGSCPAVQEHGQPGPLCQAKVPLKTLSLCLSIAELKPGPHHANPGRVRGLPRYDNFGAQGQHVVV
jgi:hypothetical protein